MQKILAKYLTGAAQVHNGKCYYVGIRCESAKNVAIHNIEESGTAHADNQVGYENGLGHILPLPGVGCSNGLYVTASSKMCIYYYI